MQTLVKSVSTRLLIQSALQRYNAGNTSDANWSRTSDDFQAVFQPIPGSTLLMQAQIFPKNDTGNNGAKSIFQITGTAFYQQVALPGQRHANGSQAYLGDEDDNFIGYPPVLYPNFTYVSRDGGPTTNSTRAVYNGYILDETSMMLLGPLLLNETFSLISLTMPIINNTSAIDILGWLTVVLDSRLLQSVVNAQEGLDNTGETILIAPDNSTNKFNTGILAGQNDNRPPDDVLVRFAFPATQRNNTPNRHPEHAFGTSNPPFDYTQYPAIKAGLTQQNDAVNHAGSLISTKNEVGMPVAVGFARPATTLVDWLVIVEQTHTEVWAPINHLRTILLGCVFATLGAMLILTFPIAHYSSRPIRRLRDATRKSVTPSGFSPDDLSRSSALELDVQDDQDDHAMAKKEGFLEYFKNIGTRRRQQKSERREEDRRRQFRIPGKVKERKHIVHDELTDLTHTFNEMTDELMMQYEKLEERVAQRTAELELSKKAAEAANESKTLFIANISHELKTPLNGILGMCAVCMSEDDPVKVKRSLGIIYKSGDLLLNLLTDLLTFR
jgi:osomolarity two-component system, sensor histidine kinase SLN1